MLVSYISRSAISEVTNLKKNLVIRKTYKVMGSIKERVAKILYLVNNLCGIKYGIQISELKCGHMPVFLYFIPSKTCYDAGFPGITLVLEIYLYKMALPHLCKGVLISGKPSHGRICRTIASYSAPAEV